MFKNHVILSQEYLGFLLLNLFDLFLTGYIFRFSGQEANGIPAFVLHHFGLRGFAIFKFVMVVMIIVLCEVINKHSFIHAQQVILGACALYVVVVLYEIYLIVTYTYHPLPVPKPDAQELIRTLRALAWWVNIARPT